MGHTGETSSRAETSPVAHQEQLRRNQLRTVAGWLIAGAALLMGATIFSIADSVREPNGRPGNITAADVARTIRQDGFEVEETGIQIDPDESGYNKAVGTAAIEGAGCAFGVDILVEDTDPVYEQLEGSYATPEASFTDLTNAFNGLGVSPGPLTDEQCAKIGGQTTTPAAG